MSSSIEFFCNLAEPATSLPHFWEHMVGSDHATIALRADWQRQLQRCHKELGFKYVRFHGLLSDDMGTLVRENDRLVYSFFNADQVFDFLLSIGMKPFVELSFMPTAIASGARTVFKYAANVTPPRDYKQWATLIKKLVSHWVERYGAVEVRKWFFEVWNEPNLKSFWTGTQRDYFKLYRYTVEAIKDVDASLRVGGPATAKSQWIEEFVDFCERNRLPADFISTHQYPTDNFERDPETEVQLFKSQRGIMREVAQDTKRKACGRPVYYTEWNSSSNPRDPFHDEPYAAAFAVATIMEAKSLVDGYSFWTFSDIFEENYFPSVPFHGGCALLNLHGIAKPTYRAFKLLHTLGTERLLVDGLHETVNARVTRDEAGLRALFVNHALLRHSIASARVRLLLAHAPEPSSASIERIDEHHANAKRRWQAVGSPEYLDSTTLEQLHEASRVTREVCSWTWREKRTVLELELP